jgi:hypothetical protein
MPPRLPLQASDVRGAARLATDATAGLTDLVEADARAHRPPARHRRGTRAKAAPRGITGLVYKSVRGVTRLVGGSIDALLGLLTPALAAPADAPPNPEREALVAALNGVLGDYLWPRATRWPCR